MTTFPPSFLDEIRARLPLSGIVGSRVRLLRAGREFKVCCPFHNEKSPSFYVNDDKQFFHCFGCGAHGDVIGFTMRHDRLSFPEAIEVLAGQAGLPMPRDTPVEREKFDHEKRLLQLLDRATAWFEEQLFSPAGREALGYLYQRGLGDPAIRRFRLGYAPSDAQALIKKLTAEGYALEDLLTVGLVKKSEERAGHYSFFRNRVIFPVGDSRGRTVAFGGRVLGDGEPKYLNSPDHPLFHKGRLLYGLSRARAAIAQNQPIIVVEGYMDVIALAESGYMGAVAPLGTALTEEQLGALWKLLPPPDTRESGRDYTPILCFDGDKAGMRAAARAIDRALPLLTPAQSLRIAFMPEGQDPDDLLKQSGKPAMNAVLDDAKPMIDAVWDNALAGRALRTPEERGSFIATIKQRVGVIAHEGLRRLYLDEIQSRLAVMFQPVKQPFVKNDAPRGTWRRGVGYQPPPSTVGLVRRQPTVSRLPRERALLAVILNHPSLFTEFGEDFGRIDMTHAPFESLRQKMVEALETDHSEPLATDTLRMLLTEDEPTLAVTLAEVLSEATYIHAGFARPDRTLDQARHGLKALWASLLHEHLEADLHAARRRFAEEASDENLARLMALRSQLEHLSQVNEDSGDNAAG